MEDNIEKTNRQKSNANLRAGGPGRPAGVPNKATTKAREVIARIADDMAEEFQQWIKDIAYGKKIDAFDKDGNQKWEVRPDPAQASRLYLDALEFHVPKLQRTEIAGDPNSAPIIVKITDDIPRG